MLNGGGGAFSSAQMRKPVLVMDESVCQVRELPTAIATLEGPVWPLYSVEPILT